MKLQPFYRSSKYSAQNHWLVWLLIGSCLLTTCDNPHGFPFPSFESAIAIINLGVEVAKLLKNIWDELNKSRVSSLTHEKIQHKTIEQHMEQLNVQIRSNELKIFSSAEQTIATLIEHSAVNNQLTKKLKELTDLMNQINSQEHAMRPYLKSSGRLESLTVEQLTRNKVGPDPNSVEEVLSKIDVLVWGSRDFLFKERGILEQLLNVFKEYSSSMCDVGLSAQQVIYHLYNAIAITDMKGYSTIQFSWMLRNMYGKGNFTFEANLLHQQFEEHTNRTQNLLQRFMAQASREYWRCDPASNQHKEGTTYLQITRLLQGYIANEMEMHTYDTCTEDCAYFKLSSYKLDRCYPGEICQKQPYCQGTIYECEYIDYSQKVCLATKDSARRYEYIEYPYEKVRGDKNGCTQNTTDVNSWLRGFVHCTYCFCYCDDAGSPYSDRFINMRQSVSDVVNNKVVTGLRFVKRRRVIFLIVQQGTLLPQGQIDDDTLEWVEVEEYNVKSSDAQNGVDYHELTMDNRFMDLDDIILPQSYVLTGVRFRLLGGHLNLEARMTEMDFRTGELVHPHKSIWTASNNYGTRTRVYLNQTHIPLLTTKKSIPDSTTNQFIKFHETSVQKDAAQTTVPFFDAQPVVPTDKVPLGGCGVFHKGQPGFGGYIAPKVFTFDYLSHVQVSDGTDD